MALMNRKAVGSSSAGRKCTRAAGFLFILVVMIAGSAGGPNPSETGELKLEVQTPAASAQERGAVYYITRDTPLWERPLSERFQSESKAILTRGAKIEVGTEMAGCMETSPNTKQCRWQIVVYPPQYHGLWIQTSRLCNPYIHGFKNCPFPPP